MATPNFAVSTSSFRASQSAAPMSPSYSDNPLTQLPRVDFNFEDLRQRMNAFTAKFDAFIEKGRKRVLEERNEFRGRLGELAGTSCTSSEYSYCWSPPQLQSVVLRMLRLHFRLTTNMIVLQRTAKPQPRASAPSPPPSPHTHTSSPANPPRKQKCTLPSPPSRPAINPLPPTAPVCAPRSRQRSARSTPSASRNKPTLRKWTYSLASMGLSWGFGRRTWARGLRGVGGMML